MTIAYSDDSVHPITDGVLSTYGQFVKHIMHLRSSIASAEITVNEMLQEGRKIADRHTVSIEKHDGLTSSFEVLLIGELADDGRLLRVVETTRQLTGEVADAGMGSARL
jgi:hypothetical protein